MKNSNNKNPAFASEESRHRKNMDRKKYGKNFERIFGSEEERRNKKKPIFG